MHGIMVFYHLPVTIKQGDYISLTDGTVGAPFFDYQKMNKNKLLKF